MKTINVPDEFAEFMGRAAEALLRSIEAPTRAERDAAEDDLMDIHLTFATDVDVRELAKLNHPGLMDLNLALAIVAAESADDDRRPYFWPMAELVSFLITECDPADDDEPVLAAIQAQPELARERAAEIDRQVAASKARAQAHEAAWLARRETIS